jgi:hypothetical protein
MLNGVRPRPRTPGRGATPRVLRDRLSRPDRPRAIDRALRCSGDGRPTLPVGVRSVEPRAPGSAPAGVR